MEVISLETWKDIPGYEGKYQASDMGRIRSLDQKVRGVCHFTGKEFYRNVKGQVLSPGQFCKSGH
ncbi:MAG: HNH endonuclease, partial [Clostridiaceae bacterium]|nr:HNH endonuclease [Clostridiaceae bacterium]